MVTNSNGMLSICLYYGCLRSVNMRHFPWKCILNSKVPKKVVLFVWTIVLGKILGIDNPIKLMVSVNQFSLHL